MPEFYFPYCLSMHGGALTGLKYFKSTNNLFWLLLGFKVIIMHLTNSAVFSEEYCMENTDCYLFDVHPHKCLL